MTCPRCAESEHLLRELVEAWSTYVRFGVMTDQIVALDAARAYLATTPERSPIREAVEIADFRGTR